MRKFAILLTLMLIAVSAMAIPAHRGAVTVTQPDGTKLTIRLVGDEFYHFNTTDDGYTVMKNAAGVYEYARRDGQSLALSGVKAHNMVERSNQENQFVSTLSKRMMDRATWGEGEARRTRRDAPSKKAVDYNNFRGLIVLINFSDTKFTMSDPQAFYDDMINTEGFTGYTDERNGSQVNCTGSMHDYYKENSNGKFQPQFDIVGPYTVDYKSTDVRGTSNAQTIFRAALRAAYQAGVNFNNYDADNDGYVDMVFFQCAGMSSAFSGNNSNLLWPHKSNIYGTAFGGKRFSLYACSTELYGWQSAPSSIDIEGIGTMCHEFTHVLGFPDLYDTDYESSGGESHHPGEWDVMAGGGSYNTSRTPVGYTIFERYALGFATPTEIEAPGHYTLNSVMSNEGYILRSPIAGEYFIMDNRQKTRWDYFLPGHGMVVCRVDSTNTSVWANNKVNANPSRNYYEMFRAGNSTEDAKSSDPFPGTMGVTDLTSTSNPALKTWSGMTGSLGITNIAEKNGVISFDVVSEAEIKRVIEDFESMPATTSKTAQGVQGVYTTWNFNQCFVTAPGADKCDGAQAVSMVLPSAFTMAAPVYYNTQRVTFDVYNASSVAAKYALSYSTDGGTTWTVAKDLQGNSAFTVAGKANMSGNFPMEFTNKQGVLYRITQTAGSKTARTYVDNFTIYYEGEPGQPEEPGLKGDVNGDGTIDVTDVNLAINVMLGKSTKDEYPASDVNGDGIIDVTDVNMIINIMLGK